MKFLEKDLEQIIYESDKLFLAQRGLCIAGNIKRQLRIGNYGVADLVTLRRPYLNIDSNVMFKGEITVYELKQEKIGINAFLQAVGYLKGIQDYLKNIRNININNYNYKIILIGKHIDVDSSYVYLPDLLSNNNHFSSINEKSTFELRNYIYYYEIDGIKFQDLKGYALRVKGF